MDLDTVIGSRVNTSVSFNGLYVPANSISEYVWKYSEPAMFHTDGDAPYTITKSGSLTKIKVAGRFFAIATNHQLAAPGYDYEQLCMHDYSDRSYVTSNQVYYPNGSYEEKEDLDILLFEFTNAVNTLGLSSVGWYDIATDLKRVHTPKPLMVCCVGYPGSRNSIDYEAKRYKAIANAVWGTEERTPIRGRLAFRPKQELSIDPAGMSGGPVFGIARDGNVLTANLSGILTNASRQKFNFISLRRIGHLFAGALSQ